MTTTELLTIGGIIIGTVNVWGLFLFARITKQIDDLTEKKQDKSAFESYKQTHDAVHIKLDKTIETHYETICSHLIKINEKIGKIQGIIESND